MVKNSLVLTSTNLPKYGYDYQYEKKSCWNRTSDSFCKPLGIALGWKTVAIKNGKLEVDQRTQNCFLRFLALIAAIIILPLTILGCIMKLCSSQKEAIRSALTKALPQNTEKSRPIAIANTYHFLKTAPTPGKTYIVFARHGESEVNKLKRVGGSSPSADLGLTDKGKEDAKKLGTALALLKDQVRTVYSSPLQRAHETASIALKAMGISDSIKFKVDDRIKEKYFGEKLDGQPEEVYNKFSAKEKVETQGMNFSQKWTYKIVKDGESFKKIYDRVKAFMLETAGKHPGEVILAFGHKVSSIKIPAMGALAEKGVEVDYRDPPFNDPKNGATAVFEVDVKNQKIDLVAIDGFSFSFLSNSRSAP